tara:strand:- start:535 stop:855 length:321 start_codon:yes stop_codon:yes gene_type:complete
MVSPSKPFGTTGIWAVGTLFYIYTRERWIGPTFLRLLEFQSLQAVRMRLIRPWNEHGKRLFSEPEASKTARTKSNETGVTLDSFESSVYFVSTVVSDDSVDVSPLS